ncbi:MAG: CatA-like O-acetyltransferase [Aminipila sp.]
MKDGFHLIDMKKWSRAQTYQFFTEVVKPQSYTINVPLDVTLLKKTLKSKNIKFFPACLYLVSRAIEKQLELRLALKDNLLGYWEFLNPQYPVFHEDDKTITFLWTEYNRDFKVFYNEYLKDGTQYGDDHGIISSKGTPPQNSYIIACVPWFTFNSFSMHINPDKYYAPLIELGGFSESDGVITIPLSITMNHAAADGYQIKVFLDELQWDMNHPEEWL